LAELDLRHPKISFDGPAEPRIINATPESCLVERPNIEPTKDEVARKAVQKKIQAVVNPALNQSLGEVAESTTSVGGAEAVPASEQKTSVAMFALFNRIDEKAKKVQAIQAEIDEEKRKLAGDLEALEKKVADQEREWTRYFEAIKKQMARLTLA